MAKLTQCDKCGGSKPLNKFGPDQKNSKGMSSWCTDCRKDFQKVYTKKRKESDGVVNPQRAATIRWYGLTELDYEDLFRIQGGVCAGCKRPTLPGKNLSIDHKHQVGDKKREPFERALSVRGLLCYLCNRVLGLLRDNPDTFANLARYLESPPASSVVWPRYNGVINSIESEKGTNERKSKPKPKRNRKPSTKRK